MALIFSHDNSVRMSWPHETGDKGLAAMPLLFNVRRTFCSAMKSNELGLI